MPEVVICGKTLIDLVSARELIPEAARPCLETLRRYCRAGLLPSVKVGRVRWVRPDAIALLFGLADRPAPAVRTAGKGRAGSA